MTHNREALKFLLKQIIPEVHNRFPNQFIFHIFGGKIPAEFFKYFIDDVIKHNYLLHEKYEELMTTMDIAVVPSLFGAGMQQKIFEPLARGFPTITSERGLAGYLFKAGEHLLLASTADEFAARLGELQDVNLRRRLGMGAKNLAMNLFGEKKIELIVQQALATN